MGISGLWDQIDAAGELIALQRAAQQVRVDGQLTRPLRVAIDISIWAFHVRSAEGGDCPAERTLFNRLVRLLNLGIHAVFVFDGQHRPRVKRNKVRSTGSGKSSAFREMPSYKRLIRACGFQAWQAPGEAEAECAYLQQRGLVDAVLSDDVDALAFGATKVFKNWGALNYSGSKTDANGKKVSGQASATHAKLFTAERLRERTKIARAGHILVALMSGGDYDTEGLKGCGAMIAFQAAVAGFGETLVTALQNGTVDAWREQLREELITNKSNFFSGKHKAIAAHLDSFPNTMVADQYLNPTVTTSEAMHEKIGAFNWYQQPDLMALRELGSEYLDMVSREGDLKLIRTMALPQFMLALVSRIQQEATFEIVNKPRQHPSTDDLEELRVRLVPRDWVPIPIEEKEDLTEHEGQPVEAASEFDVLAPKLHWIPRYLLERAHSERVRAWERASVAPKTPKKRVLASPEKRLTAADRKQSESADPSQLSLKDCLPVTKRLAAPLESDEEDDLPEDLRSFLLQKKTITLSPVAHSRITSTTQSSLKQTRLHFRATKFNDPIVILSSPEATPGKQAPLKRKPVATTTKFNDIIDLT
ncbi:PIN domain-like protein [Protomyces lactucae-debilis]|uniref:PIN domain-like protein n=1 Tax=Protomyces lactucae-debilis TaxID=2754530 RepID=A0A1Y2F3N6_PROLT|nr:PIN domain-like protein [Protomyces lactucae-debilis]ORY78518.1 PIN domain-like protein [Protomyces lactucae-debilis]